jgi:hypothetical protein
MTEYDKKMGEEIHALGEGIFELCQGKKLLVVQTALLAVTANMRVENLWQKSSMK